MDHQCRARDLIFFGECVFLHVYHVWFLCVIPTWAMTLSYVCHDPFLCVTWIICMCTMTHISVHHASWTISVVLETWSPSKKKRALVCRDSYLCVCPIIQWLTFMCTMTHIYECDVFPMFVMTHIYQLNASWTRGLKTWFHNKKTWAFERGKGTVHLPMYLRTHTLTYTYTHAQTHTYVHTFRLLQIKSKLNQSKAGQITPNIGTTGNLNSAETWEQIIQTLF